MTITRTFSTQLLPTYTSGTIIEFLHFRDMAFDADERTAFYLDSANAVIDIGSFNIGKIPDLDGDESDVEQALALSKSEAASNKIGLRFLARKNNTGNWGEIAEFTLMNYGRKDYLDLRGRLGYPTRLMEKNDALAVQLIDYGDGLLWDTDFIKIDIGCTIEIAKKNDNEALMARISALELALEGRLINLPADSLLGRNAGTGTVERIARNTFKASDSELIDGIDSSRIVLGDDWSKTIGAGQTPNEAFTTSGFLDIWGAPNSIFPPGANHINGFQARHRNGNALWGMQAGCQHNIANEFYFRSISASIFNPWRRIWNDGNLPISFPSLNPYGSISIPTSKNGYAGIHFPQGFNSPVLMIDESSNLSGMWSATGNPSTWMWMYNNGAFDVFNSNTNSEGSYIGLRKNLGSLPGYPNHRFPTLSTDDDNLYFSVAGAYSAYINVNGVYTSVSDRNKKENFIELDEIAVLEIIKGIPVYTYNFKESDARIRNAGCMAQDFYKAFKLGGDEEVDADDSPTCPSKMMSTADVAGICMAAIKGLNKKIFQLENTLKSLSA